MPTNRLFREFSKQSKEAWFKRIKSDLEIDKIQLLNWLPDLHVNMPPFAHPEDLPIRHASIRENVGWRVGSIVDVEDAILANKEALYLLKCGTETLHFRITDHGDSLQLSDLLKGIQLEWISLQFEVSNTDLTILLENLSGWIRENNFQPSSMKISIYLNTSHVVSDDIWGPMQSFQSRRLVFSTDTEETSAALIDSIALMIHHGNEYIKKNRSNISSKLIRNDPIGFSLISQENYLLNISILRAIRIVWMQVLHAWKLNDIWEPHLQMRIKNSSFKQDKNLEKISFTTQAMSAATGGSDQIFIDATGSKPDADAEVDHKRLLLNIQHLLKMESHFDWTADPASGSYFIENLTDQLAHEIWKRFQVLDRDYA